MLTKKILFSIIIPYYSKKQILSKCLEKLLNQKISKDYFEIIIIDDGSGHDLISIIKKYIKVNLNIKLIKLLKNRGPGIARNKGLSISKGRYILFLDTDDFLKNDTLLILKKIIQKKSVDIISYNFELHSKVITKYARNDYNILNVNLQKFIKLFLSMNYNNSVIFSIYKRSLIIDNKIKFKSGYHEDIFFFFQSFFFSKSKIFLNKNLYIKNNYNNSIINTFSKKHINDYIKSWIDIKKFLILKYGSKLFYKNYLKSYSKGLLGISALVILKNIRIVKNRKKRLFYYSILFEEIKKYNIKDINKSNINYISKYDRIFILFLRYFRSKNNFDLIKFEKEIANIK